MSINMDAKSERPISQQCVEHGKRLKAARIAAGKTLIDIFVSGSQNLVVASRIERGMIDNLHITPEEWVNETEFEKLAAG